MLVSSDRHVSMDAVSVTVHTAAESGLELKLRGFAGLEVVYRVFVPGGVKSAESEGAEALFESEEDITKVSVKFTGETASLTLSAV